MRGDCVFFLLWNFELNRNVYFSGPVPHVVHLLTHRCSSEFLSERLSPVSVFVLQIDLRGKPSRFP